MTQYAPSKKVTMATVKSMIKRGLENDNLYIRIESDFDGMTDCVEHIDGATFRKAEKTTVHVEHTHGVKGLWCVGSSRDSFYDMEWTSGKLSKVTVYNCCGSATLKVM